MKTFRRDDKCRNAVAGTGPDGVLIMQFSFNEGFHCGFELLVIKSTLIIAEGDDAVEDLIHFKHPFGQVDEFVDTLSDGLILT
jgi:hypothetical protein